MGQFVGEQVPAGRRGCRELAGPEDDVRADRVGERIQGARRNRPLGRRYARRTLPKSWPKRGSKNARSSGESGRPVPSSGERHARVHRPKRCQPPSSPETNPSSSMSCRMHEERPRLKAAQRGDARRVWSAGARHALQPRLLVGAVVAHALNGPMGTSAGADAGATAASAGMRMTRSAGVRDRPSACGFRLQELLFLVLRPPLKLFLAFEHSRCTRGPALPASWGAVAIVAVARGMRRASSATRSASCSNRRSACRSRAWSGWSARSIARRWPDWVRRRRFRSVPALRAVGRRPRPGRSRGRKQASCSARTGDKSENHGDFPQPSRAGAWLQSFRSCRRCRLRRLRRGARLRCGRLRGSASMPAPRRSAAQTGGRLE